MKLKKTDRERLYKAKGKSVLVEWPLADAPRKGQRHAVHGDSGERVFSIRVEAVRWRQGSALVVMDNDPIRILPGLTDEPERVSARYERLLCSEAEARNALLQGENVRRRQVESKEARIGRSPRAERAIARHSRSLAAKTSSGGGILPLSPAGPADAVISSGG